MSTTILSPLRWRIVAHAVWRMIETGLAALGQSWLDAVDARRGPSGSEWDPRHGDADEDLRLMVALYCATFH